MNLETTTTTTPKPKPRPITSCSACRARKVKCNRLSPCSACIARNTPAECTYTTTDEDRQAIAQADLISELRATRNRLQSQLARGSISTSTSTSTSYAYPEAASQIQIPAQNQGRNRSLGTGSDDDGDDGDDDGDDTAALEAVYAALRRGSWDLAQQLITRIRNGEPLRDMVRAAELEYRYRGGRMAG